MLLGLRNIDEGKVFWADLNSDSDYDAKDFMPKMRANIGNQIVDQKPSPVIDSNQAAPKGSKEGRRCLTSRNVLANLKSDSEYDAKDLMPKMCVNLGNQIGDQTPSAVIDSNQVAPKRPKEGRRCLTLRNLLKELANLLVKDVFGVKEAVNNLCN